MWCMSVFSAVTAARPWRRPPCRVVSSSAAAVFPFQGQPLSSSSFFQGRTPSQGTGPLPAAATAAGAPGPRARRPLRPPARAAPQLSRPRAPAHRPAPGCRGGARARGACSLTLLSHFSFLCCGRRAPDSCATLPPCSSGRAPQHGRASGRGAQARTRPGAPQQAAAAAITARPPAPRSPPRRLAGASCPLQAPPLPGPLPQTSASPLPFCYQPRHAFATSRGS
ncbi:MAG: hypothetical protein J3K34DRAFT_177413 [Monoraphidium minutum]|nr:MAG: hypothetical protein J3K34DRAFT_177413 [Monoraphidium minutum]